MSSDQVLVESKGLRVTERKKEFSMVCNTPVQGFSKGWKMYDFLVNTLYVKKEVV